MRIYSPGGERLYLTRRELQVCVDASNTELVIGELISGCNLDQAIDLSGFVKSRGTAERYIKKALVQQGVPEYLANARAIQKSVKIYDIIDGMSKHDFAKKYNINCFVWVNKYYKLAKELESELTSGVHNNVQSNVRTGKD